MQFSGDSDLVTALCVNSTCPLCVSVWVEGRVSVFSFKRCGVCRLLAVPAAKKGRDVAHLKILLSGCDCVCVCLYGCVWRELIMQAYHGNYFLSLSLSLPPSLCTLHQTHTHSNTCILFLCAVLICEPVPVLFA